jgi:hypothetical protein
MEPVARALLGEPNERLSKPGKLRFGTNGSLSVDLDKGQFFDFEADKGGGVLKLIEHKKGLAGKHAFEFMRELGCDVDDPPRDRRARNKRKITKTYYDYLDADEQLIYQVVREESVALDGKRKSFFQRRPYGLIAEHREEQKWIWGLKGGDYIRGSNGDWFVADDKRRTAWHGAEILHFEETAPILYRLPELQEELAQPEAERRLILVPEGEKDVETLLAWNCLATTNSGGSNGWQPHFGDYFAGLDVAILADADDGGRKFAHEKAAALAGIARSVRVLDFAEFWRECPVKGDVTDWANDGGGTVAKLFEIVEKLVEWTPAEIGDNDGAVVADEPAPAMSLDEYSAASQPRRVDLSTVPLTIREWIDRELPEPDCLMGAWLTTTSRVQVSAPTGIGKSILGLALAAHMAAGRDFLHWRAHRPARVLFVDGEMSRRLLKRRAQDVCRRCGFEPEGLFLLSHEDIDGFQPLNTAAGKALIERIIEKIGVVDAIVFDNVMALITGDMKEEEGWQRALPLVDALTKRAIGQIWVHHTGHDTTRSYGTKTREWRMDTTIHLTEEKRADTDVSFRLEFQKARERTPETRRDFEDVTVALVDDQWTCSAATLKRGKPAPLETKFLEALQDALAGDGTTKYRTWNTVKAEQWRAECVRRGLLDPAKPASARTLFNRYRRDLIAHNLIACDGEFVWLL